MKVVNIITDSNIGGAGVLVESIVKNMSPAYSLYVVLPTNSKMVNRFKKIKNVKVIELDGIKDVSLSYKGIVNLYKLIKKLKPDIVHTHSSLSGRIAARIYRKAYIVNTRHCVEPLGKKGAKFHIKNFINNLLTDKVIGVSEGVYNNLIDSGINKEKAVQIDNCVAEINVYEQSKIDEIKSRYNIGDKLVIGFLGRLEDVKNPLALIHIANYMRKTRDDFVFLVGGVGSLEDEFNSMIKKHSLENNFISLGYVKDLVEFYSLIDVCVNTSKSEAISLTILEAMSSKKPIVAFDVDKLSQVIKNDYNGYLIKSFDHEKFGDIVLNMFDSELRNKLGNNSYSIYEKSYKIDVMIDKIQNLYDKGCLTKEKTK